MPEKPDTITITLTREAAESISYGLADLLCWHRGFAAAREGMDLDQNSPMGIESVRTISLKLKDAL